MVYKTFNFVILWPVCHQLFFIMEEQTICNLTTSSTGLVLNNSMKFWTCAELTRDILSPYFRFNELPLTDTQKNSYIYGFSTIIVLSIILNLGLIIYILRTKCKTRVRRYRPKTDDFIISLAVSDLLIIFLVVPFNIYRIYTEYEWTVSNNITLNTWSCHLFAYVQSVCVLSSMFTLTALSVDR